MQWCNGPQIVARLRCSYLVDLVFTPHLAAFIANMSSLGLTRKYCRRFCGLRTDGGVLLTFLISE